MRHLLTYNDLDDARCLTQVNERHTAVIATSSDPSSEGDLLADVLGAQASGVMGTDHVTCSLLGGLRMCGFRSSVGGFHVAGSAST